MKNFIPYGRQNIDKKDIIEVTKSLKKNLITTGSYVKKFEIAFKSKIKSKFCIACSSGTAALHLAFMSINVKKNDIVILPVINFVAASNILKMLGAKIYFADVDKFTGQMTPKTLLECLKKNKLRKIKAIVTMYLGGFPENIREFYLIKKKLKCFLIEDACHALGASYKINKKKYLIGSCKHSDICTFSLHPIKTITSGEGGLVTTNNNLLAQRLKLLRSHGIDRKIGSKKSPHWIYNINYPGLNYRLSDINSALGYSQLKKVKKFVDKREKIAESYTNYFKNFKDLIITRKIEKNLYSSWHLFVLIINFKKLKKTKDALLKFLFKKKIIAQQHYIPLYKHTYFKEHQKQKFINADFYFKNAISIPIFFNLNKKEINHVKSCIFQFIKKNV